MSSERGPNPLGEVFGWPADNLSETASEFRLAHGCPFFNHTAACTKDKKADPLGVCSVRVGTGRNDLAITCPVRFREDWLIAQDAAQAFFPETNQWACVTEVNLKDRQGKSAGHVDMVIVTYDPDTRQISDFGMVEVQAVYVSGNIREPFQWYMEAPGERHSQAWTGPNYPHPDYLSSSRKRLLPQLFYKGSIVNAWGKKIAIVLHKAFYESLPALQPVPAAEADLIWLIYDLVYDETAHRHRLSHTETMYTRFNASLARLSNPEIGVPEDFVTTLQLKLDRQIATSTRRTQAGGH